jgi:hypothetical protein
MPQRRRYATQDELAELITERLNPEPTGGDIVAALAELGVPVDALVKVTVDEDVAPDLQ